jgi:predicted amidohydrolase
MTRATIAAWQYPIDELRDFGAWRAKLLAGVAEAAARGARLLVVPEYAAMELTALLPEPARATLAAQLVGLQPLLADYVAAYGEAARRHGIAIVGGSFPERMPDGRYRNRARIHAPSGETVAVVEKLLMTRFEREVWGIGGGTGQVIVELDGGLTLGVAVCYDSEFPLIARRLAVAGANVIAVPSCTDALAGYWRVRVAAQARALENQCYVVHAPTVGAAPWSIAVDTNVGAAAVYAPPDRGFPVDGVVAVGPMSEPFMLTAELDLALVEAARRDGLVLGHRDWELPAHLAGEPVTRAPAR